MKKGKWLPRINIILFIILIVGGAFVLFYPVNPLTINSVIVEGKEFKAGSELKFKVDRCKTVDETTDGTANRYLVDQKNKDIDPYFLGTRDDLGKQGCAVSERTLVLPAHIPDGEYKLCFVVKYYPSVLRSSVKKEFCSDNTFHVKGLTVAAQLENILEQIKRIEPDIVISKDTRNTNTDNLANAPELAQPQSVTPPTPPAQQTEQTPQQSQRSMESQENSSYTIIDHLQGTINGLLKGVL